MDSDKLLQVINLIEVTIRNKRAFALMLRDPRNADSPLSKMANDVTARFVDLNVLELEKISADLKSISV